MIGVLNIYKEKGLTSFKVVAIIRRLTGEKKVGHTGTLDPDATGVLPVCIGRATKLVGQLTDTDKEYRAVMLLGRKTDTQDISGQILEEMSQESIRRAFDRERLFEAFKAHTGQIEQLPPMYSAVKVDGVKLVDAARKGREVERTPRKATIYSIEDIVVDEETYEISFTVACSKGTYIRTLCEDIGDMIGIPACMKELERTKAAGFTLEDTITLDEARKYAAEGTLEERLIPVDSLFGSYGQIVVNADAVRRLVFGNWMFEEDIDRTMSEPKPAGSAVFRVYDKEGNFYALYRYDSADDCYKAEKMFV